jgi:GntR family transcriptional regulator, transcriptional repressor for pyruvate dehydrogenase complex
MEVAAPTAWRARGTPEQRDAIFDRHRDIARADADPDAARAAMEAHFDASIGELLME